MAVVTCPQLISPWQSTFNVVFLAGGISNCPDWQVEMAELLKGDNGLTLINPRRYNFNITDPDMSREQIKWEHEHLEISDGILFWFPKETLCPITLFELGKYARSDKQIYVGCHPEYARKFDVEFQLELIGHKRPIVTTLEALALQVLEG